MAERCRTALGTGSILCTGGPWQVRVAGSRAAALRRRLLLSPAAGADTRRPGPPPERHGRGVAPEVIFRTTLAAYVSGVLAAEHAGLGGEAGLALAQVIAHDARVERHPGRPLCDTTHCQVFLGTAAPTPEVRRGARPARAADEPLAPVLPGWGRAVGGPAPRAEVRAVLGDAQRFSGDGRSVEIVRSSGVERIPCEQVRAALRLPGCPTGGTSRARRSGSEDAGAATVWGWTSRGPGLRAVGGGDPAPRLRSPLIPTAARVS